MRDPTAPTIRGASNLRTVAALGALSGGAVLVGEVMGGRLLRPVVGGATIAQSGTLAGVLGGIGLGAYAVGRWLGRRDPRRALAATLGALAAGTFAAPWSAQRLAHVVAPALVRVAEDSPTLSALAGATTAALLTAPFGLLAGAVYPLLAAASRQSADRATALSGGASSLGAALSVLFVTFGLAPRVGVTACLHGAAGVLAVSALLTLGLQTATVDGMAADSDAEAEPTNRVRGAWVALVLLGACSTLAQVATARLGALAFGPSAYAMAAALSAQVGWLAVGEAWSWLDRRRTRDASTTLETAARWFAIGAGLWLLTAPLLVRLAGDTTPLLHTRMAALWSVQLALLGLSVAPLGIALGRTLPAGAAAVASGSSSAATGNGRALAAMACGNVAGALLGANLLLPAAGLRGLMVLTTALALLASAAVAGFRPSRASRMGMLVAAFCAAAGWVRWDATQLMAGPFLYSGPSHAELGRLIWWHDDREAAVALRRDDEGSVLLQVDGKVDATSAGDAATQLVVGLLPTLLHGAARDVLLVGLGSGMTADGIRAVPGVRAVRVDELLPSVVRAAAAEFAPFNGRVMQDTAHVRVRSRDAALDLRGTRETFDVIVSQPSNPWVSGMSDLFTAEVLGAMRARLRPGGVAAMWFHGYGVDASTVQGLLATFRDTFPECQLAEVVPLADYVLLGRVPDRSGSVTVDVDAFAALAESEAVRARLARAGIPSPGDLLGRIVAGAEGMAAMTRDVEPLRAGDLFLEFRAPALLYSNAAAELHALLARAQDLPLAGWSPRGTRYAALIDVSETHRAALSGGRALWAHLAAGALDAAVAAGEQAVAAAPEDATLRNGLSSAYLRRARARQESRDPGAAEQDVRTALEVATDPAERFRAWSVLGDFATRRGDHPAAARAYAEAWQIARETGASVPGIAVRLAVALLNEGNAADAHRVLEHTSCEGGPECATIETLRARAAALAPRAPASPR